MPLTEVVESRVVMACISKERTKPTNCILDPPYKGCECTTAMHSHFTHDEKVWSGMLAHQDPTDLAPFCTSERINQ